MEKNEDMLLSYPRGMEFPLIRFMNPNEYGFWRNMLLGKGFKEPFCAYCYNSYTYTLDSYMVFARDCCKVSIHENDLTYKKIPKVIIETDNMIVYAAKGDFKNIERVIDAIINPDNLCLCVGIPWAAPLIEFLLLKEVPTRGEVFLCETHKK